MAIAKSEIVKSAAGRDKGQFFFVLETEGDFLLLADGRKRRLECPKRKKRKHVEFVPASQSAAAEKIRCGENITNRELRKALAVFGETGNPDQEG